MVIKQGGRPSGAAPAAVEQQLDLRLSFLLHYSWESGRARVPSVLLN